MTERGMDPVLVSILQKRYESICEEMARTLLRTTKSPILNEARDFCTGIYNAKGEMLGQAEYIPVLAMAVPYALEYIINYFGDEIYDGDVIIHNDTFRLGNQLTDIAIFRPIFYDSKHVAWAVCKGHVADIGGSLPGGYNPTATEVWQEGIRIPPTKIYEQGRFRKDVWDLIFSNIRFPFIADDIQAEIGGTKMGERGIQAVIEKYGFDVYESHNEALFEMTEKMLRSQIAAMPDGEYRGECSIAHDSVGPGKWTVRVTITIKGDDMTLNFTGSGPKARGFLNQPYASFISAVWISLFQHIKIDLPHNAGLMRPVKVINDEPSFINAPYPMPTAGGNHLTTVVTHAISNALREALPEMVHAGWNREAFFLGAGINPRTNDFFTDISFLAMKGGGGAVYGANGYDHIGLIACSGGLLAQDFEMFEFHNPIFLHYLEFDMDSAGPGKWRGGLGTYCEMDLEGEEMSFSETSTGGFGNSDFDVHYGIFGGMAGSLNKVTYYFPDGSEKNLKYGLGVIRPCPKGTRYLQIAGGGGGYGDPFLRPEEDVLEEVRNELVSFKQAKEAYGVVVEGNIEHPSSLKVNEKETYKMRSSRPTIPLPIVKKNL